MYLVYRVNASAVKAFVGRYPLAGKSIEEYIENCNTGSCKFAYVKWLDSSEEAKESEAWGAVGNTVVSPSFGTKTFYKYDWNGCSGWAEIFEYYWGGTK